MALEDCGGLKQQVVLPWLQGEAEGPMGRGAVVVLHVAVLHVHVDDGGDTATITGGEASFI